MNILNILCIVLFSLNGGKYIASGIRSMVFGNIFSSLKFLGLGAICLSVSIATATAIISDKRLKES